MSNDVIRLPSSARVDGSPPRRLLLTRVSDVMFGYSTAKELGMVPVRFLRSSEIERDPLVSFARSVAAVHVSPVRLHTEGRMPVSVRFQDGVQLSPLVASYNALNAGIASSQPHPAVPVGSNSNIRQVASDHAATLLRANIVT
jgi:hypothetical protein